MALRKRKKQKTQKFSVQKWDPLFIIFEKHLYDFNYESREIFINAVVADYLEHLASQKVIVPMVWQTQLEKSLSEEVSDMLVCRLYGCLTVEEFKQKQEDGDELIPAKKNSRRRYQKLTG